MKHIKALYSRIRLVLSSNSGFTLIELMIVIVIIAILAGVIGPKFFGQTDKAKISSAKSQIMNFKTALENYKLDNGNYPTADQGLKSLVEKPTSDPIPQSYATKGYLDSKTLPQDPWKHDYVYTSDGSDYTIISLGADGKEGGDNFNADIKSDELNK
jgi:general secretion pathway protein G